MCSITSCWKGFKLKNFLRFARTPVTKRKRAWMLKKLWMPFLAHTSASGWTTLFRTITGYSTRALYNDFVFELTLAPALQVPKGSDALKLVYKQTNIQMEYETIRRRHWQTRKPVLTTAVRR